MHNALYYCTTSIVLYYCTTVAGGKSIQCVAKYTTSTTSTTSRQVGLTFAKAATSWARCEASVGAPHMSSSAERRWGWLSCTNAKEDVEDESRDDSLEMRANSERTWEVCE